MSFSPLPSSTFLVDENPDDGENQGDGEGGMGSLWRRLKGWGRDRGVRSDAVAVYALFVLLGISSWLIPNGVFVELPYLTTELPEKWSIASYLSITLQIANVVPLIYATMLRKLSLNDQNKNKNESKNSNLDVNLAYNVFNERSIVDEDRTHQATSNKMRKATTTMSSKIDAITVWIVLLLSFVTCVLLALFWNRTSTLFGDDKPHSVALLSIFFFSGVASTLSQVSFWPFVGRFQPVYSSAMAAGESGSGLVTSLLGVIQNPSSSSTSSRFTLETFFVVLAVIVFMSGVAAFLLMWLPIAKKEMLPTTSSASTRRNQKSTSSTTIFNLEKTKSREALLTNESEDVEEPSKEFEFRKNSLIVADYNTASSYSTTRSTSSYHVWPYYLLITWVGCLQNGVLYSILPYACLPYPNGTVVLHWAVLFSMALGPPASMIASLRYRTFQVLAILSVLFTLGSIYITLASISSLAGKLGPAWVVVAVQGLNGFGLNYARSSVFSVIHNDLAGDDENWRNDVLRRTGFCIQIGSASGALLFFLLINYTKVFA